MHWSTDNLLTSITKKIVSTANKTQLLQEVHEWVMPLLGVESTGLFVINEAENYHYDLTALLPETDRSKVNPTLNHHFANHKMEHKGSSIAYYFEQLKKSKQPLIFQYEKSSKAVPPPFYTAVAGKEVKETYGALLQVGSEPFGIFFLHSTVTGQLKEIAVTLYQQVTDLIAIALSNILTKESLQQEKQFNEILLALSETVAAIQNRQELFATIFQQVAPIIPIDNTAIVLVNEDGTAWKDFANPADHHETIASVTLLPNEPNDYQPLDGLLKKALTETGIATIEDLYKLGHAAAPVLQDLGIKALMYTPLISQGKTIGALFFESKQADIYQPTHFKFFQAIAEVIATAVSNILAKEEKEAIVVREKEKTLLLKISEAIASVQNSKQLLQVIYEKIQPVFHYDAAGLFILHPNGNSLYEITDSEILHDSAQKEITEKGLLGPFALSSFSKEFWIFAEEPFITSCAAQSEFVNDPISKQQFAIGMAHGLDEMIAGPLYCGGKKIGVLCFVVKQHVYYTQKHLTFFKSIADLIAVAVANILANQEILEKEKEKTLLLKVSNAISKIDNKVELLKCIDSLLHPIFSHADASFSIITEDQQYYIDYYALYAKDTPTTASTNPPQEATYRQFYIADSAKLPYPNSVNEYSMNQPAEKGKLEDLLPLNLNRDKLEEKIKAGLVYYLCCPLRVAGKGIGIFNLLFKQADKPTDKMLDLFTQISDRMALAFLNILSAEEIIEREMIKTKQLEILETLNQSNGWNEKFIAVAKKFDEFVGCNLFSYSIRLNDGRKMGKGFQKDPITGSFTPKSLQTYLNDMNITESAYGELYAASMGFFQGSKYHCGADLIATANKVPLLKKSIEAYGSRSLMFTEKAFPKGSILFTLNSQNDQQYNSKTLQFLEISAQQMTLSVMNILDNEEVIERERQKILEIEVNNAVLTNEDFGNVMRGISESIGKTIGCDICYIRVMSEQIDVRPFHFFCELMDGKYTVRPLDEKVADTGITSAQAAKNAFEFLDTIKAPSILSGLKLEALTPQYHYLQIFTGKIGIKSFIFLPLQLKYGCIAYLIIGSRTAYSYIDSDLAIISNIKTQLSLALDNRLAFYQIQRLKEMLETENLYLQEAINENYNFNEMVGTSPALQTVFTQASMVATTDTTVLISGETGTGKELIARAIHNLSHRKDKIMVKVNCACLPAQLIESELFGHEKGAFTGAMEKRIGKFELANGGTIFLDEIGELPLELQAKLLRVIQEREFERIGGRTVIKTDIRIIAATNKNLELESREKRFRSDLYYRLNVFPIQLPALRERREDIPLLALHFAKKFGQKMRKNIAAITHEALQEMMHYDWPGNIRELEHVVEHSVISSKSSKLSLAKPLLTDKASPAKSLTEFRIKTLNDNEREHILAILKYSNGKIRGKGGAAQLLDIHPNTLESRMLKLGIKKEHVLL